MQRREDLVAAGRSDDERVLGGVPSTSNGSARVDVETRDRRGVAVERRMPEPNVPSCTRR